ncbi:uncharacterized protein [Cicer arietinum]|uniref:uncharacterized protein n=1 Tax=Cicer arietinum TaxID=3827 RepID=UPI003CC57449
MALVLAVQHWRPYLLGRRFVVYSDQKSLRHLLEQRITMVDQQNWIAKLLGYHFEVVYKSGLENKVVDTLSKMHVEAELKGITSFPICMQQQLIQQQVMNDPQLQKNFTHLQLVATQVFYARIEDDRKSLLGRNEKPLSIPEKIWDDISMDFITGLPKSKGFEAILVVVDRLSKYGHFIPLKHPYTARKVAEIFIEEVVRLHGVPQSIVSDRDPLFVSLF